MFSKRSGSKGNRHFRRRSTRHRRRTHKRKGGMMSSAYASKQSASASNPEKIIAVWGPWKSRTNHKAYLSEKHFEIANDNTIADLKIAISKYISKRYERGYKLPALTKIKPYNHIHTSPDFWYADDTSISHVPNELKIELPM